MIRQPRRPEQDRLPRLVSTILEGYVSWRSIGFKVFILANQRCVMFDNIVLVQVKEVECFSGCCCYSALCLGSRRTDARDQACLFALIYQVSDKGVGNTKDILHGQGKLGDADISAITRNDAIIGQGINHWTWRAMLQKLVLSKRFVWVLVGKIFTRVVAINIVISKLSR